MNPARLRPSVSALVVGAIAFLLLSGVALQWYQPAPPRDYEVDIVFPPGRTDMSEPLVVTGKREAGDFLFVRYHDERNAVLGYERWGYPAVYSAPFDVHPGTRRRVRLDLPALAHVRGGSRGGGDEVRIMVDGRETFRTRAVFNLRKSTHVFFGENPIGGSSCSREFSGWIHHLDGRTLHGNARHLFSWRERIAWWFSDGKWQVLVVALVSAGLAGLWSLLRASPGAWLRIAGCWIGTRISTHRWFAGSALLCSGMFLWVLTGGTGRLYFAENFGLFYDYQAASLMQGRLDVPEPAVSGEAFVVGKKYFGYFGLTPALLRFPLVAFDLGFGWWSRASMFVAFVVALLAAYDLLRTTLRFVAPEKTAPAPWMTVALTVNAGLGSALFFLGSRAYIYHEATLWGATFALAATACSLRYLHAPASRWWLGAWVCALLSLHARPPSGLFALVLVACTALAVAWELWRRGARPLAPQVRRHLALPLACALGVLSFNGLSYLKFGTFDGAPLKYHIQYHAARLDRIEGRNFHLANVGFNFSAYFWRPDFKLEPRFPYFHISNGDGREYPDSKIDLMEPVLALPYSLPGLVFLAVVGNAIACLRWPVLRRPALVLLVAVVPMLAAMLTAVAVSQRYLADFCPWLIALAAIGLMAVEAARAAWRRTFLALVAPLTLAAVFITVAIALHYQGTGVWGVPADVTARYQALRKKADAFFGVSNHEP